MLKKLPQPHHNPVPIDTRRVMVDGIIMIKCTACGVYALNLETNHLGRCLDCSGERAVRDAAHLAQEVADLKSRNANLQMELQFLKLEKEVLGYIVHLSLSFFLSFEGHRLTTIATSRIRVTRFGSWTTSSECKIVIAPIATTYCMATAERKEHQTIPYLEAPVTLFSMCRYVSY
jgi:hypothetical protein